MKTECTPHEKISFGKFSQPYTAHRRARRIGEASETDYDGNTTEYTYVTDQVGTYAQGMLESVTDPLGRVNTFTYNSDGQVIQQNEPGNAVRSFSFAGTGGSPRRDPMCIEPGEKSPQARAKISS